MELLIKNVSIVDNNQSFFGDVYIKGGIISQLGYNLNHNCHTIDGGGNTLLPAFTDLHAHFREPGFTYKEDILSGSLAALKGGYTTVNLMANTNPVTDSQEKADSVLAIAESHNLIDIHQTAAVTKNFDGATTAHLKEIDSTKIKFISDDGHGVVNNLVTFTAMEIAKEKGFTIMTHAEDPSLTPISYRVSENIITFRDLYLAKATGCRLHLSHVSTVEAINAIETAKKEGVQVTCEVTPHHLCLWDNDYKVNPPIRNKHDVDALIKAINSGVVDAIATDHAPHSQADKEKGAPGISGIETAFPLVYTNLVKPNKITLQQLVRLMSTNPNKIMRQNKGEIKTGFIADLVLVDLNREYEISASDFLSKGKNTPFNGNKVYGRVLTTIKAGEIKYKYEVTK